MTHIKYTGCNFGTKSTDYNSSCIDKEKKEVTSQTCETIQFKNFSMLKRYIMEKTMKYLNESTQKVGHGVRTTRDKC